MRVVQSNVMQLCVVYLVGGNGGRGSLLLYKIIIIIINVHSVTRSGFRKDFSEYS